MKYSKPITTAILMGAMLPVTQIYAAQEHNGLQQTHAQKNARLAPELFDDFGITQHNNKVLPFKAVKGRNRSVNVKTELLGSDALTLTLFEDTVVTVIRDRLIDKVKGSTTWIGHVEGELDSEVFLTSRKGSLSGTVRIGEDLYEINLGANDLHEITKIDPSKNPDFDNDIKTVEDFYTAGGQIDTTVSSEPVAANAEINAGTIIDVMIAYTPKARVNASGQSGIEAKIINAVAKANQAYINSQVDMQINLVHMTEVNYVETNNMSTSLTDITSTNDGKMDEIHALRNLYGADQVVLITADTSACGIGYIMSNPGSSFNPYAFSIVHDDSTYSCLANHTLAHELGHNQGDHHDYASASGAGAYPYSFGFRVCETGGFRTVMSYSCSGGTRVGQFSNPNVFYNGMVTGTSADDNARSMSNTKAIVAAFRGTIDLSAPIAPSSLSATTVSDAEINLNWVDNANNEIGFRLERSTDGVSWAEIASVATNVRSFADSGLTAETNYQYRARAYNSNGNSVYSNVGSATTQAFVVEVCANNSPALSIAPSSDYIQAGASVTYSISLTNQDSSDCSATTFTLAASDGSWIGAYMLTAGSTKNTTWVTTAPLTDGSYTKSVTVSAATHNDVSKSASMIVDGTAPSAPGNLSATEQRKSKVSVSWRASTDTGSGFDHYLIKRNGTTIATTTRTSYTDNPGKGTFTYTVEAYDKVGNAQGSSTSLTVGSSGSATRGKGKNK